MFPSQFNSIRTVQCLSTPDNSSTLLAVNPLLFFNANYNLTINHVLFMIYVLPEGILSGGAVLDTLFFMVNKMAALFADFKHTV